MVGFAKAVRGFVSLPASSVFLAAAVAVGLVASSRALPAAGSPFQAPPPQVSDKAQLKRINERASAMVQQSHVNFFLPQEWSSLDQSIDRLRTGLEKWPHTWDPKLAESINRQLDAFESRLPTVAEQQLGDLRRDIAGRVERLPRRAESADASIERLRTDGHAFLEEMAPGTLTVSRAYEVLRRARVFLDRFQDVEALPADPCDEAYRLALHADAVGQRGRAKELLAEALKAGCKDDAVREQVAGTLQTLSRRVEPVALPVPVELTLTAGAAAGNVPAAQPRPPRRTEIPTGEPGLELDVWQSAWGNFSGIDTLLAFAGRNQVRSVNLNPGYRLTRGSWDAQYRSLKTLTDGFRGAGIRVQYLYAELSQPVRTHAEFLVAHPDLGIDTLVDDSEFTDARLPNFKANMQAVREAGLRYAGFVTLEGVGNSGVSDETRLWAIDNLDEPVLMSYFGCSVAGQQAILRPYLEYADRVGRQREVKVALLLGSKSVGREVSCERQLDRRSLCEFVQSMLTWAVSHPSFGGLVLETNEKMPRFELRGPAERTGSSAMSPVCPG